MKENTDSLLLSETHVKENTDSSLLSETHVKENTDSSLLSETHVKENTDSSLLSETHVKENTDSSLLSETCVPENTLYIALKIDKSFILEIIDKEIKDKSILSKYKIQSEFHMTLLYTGGKENEYLSYFTPLYGMKYEIEIDKIGISENFITLGVNKMTNVPYYGNKIKHITVGIEIRNKNQKKLFPKDSPKALIDSNIIIFENPYIIEGKIEAILTNK